VGGERGNEVPVTDMWKKHFAALLNSSQNSESGNFVNENKLT